MKFALTAPIYMMKYTYQSDFLFVLAQYMKYDMYSEFVSTWRPYRVNAGHVPMIMLDNGAYENELQSAEEMLEMCDIIKPNIVVAPDRFRVMDDTIEITNAFLDEYRGNAELMVVPQGRDDNECISCYYNLLSELDFDWVGLPRWLEDTPLGRSGVYYKIKTSLVNRDLRVHLLGLPNPEELRNYRGETDIIQSVDTSWPFTFAKQGRMGKFVPDERVDMICIEDLPKHQIRSGIEYIYSIIGEL